MFLSKFLREVNYVLQCAKYLPMHLNQCRQIRGSLSPVIRKNRANIKYEDVKKKKFISENPGVGHTLSVLSDSLDEKNLEDTEEDDLDEERDFFDSHKDYGEFQREQAAHKKKLDYHITKQRYFRPPVEPSFLTFAEKEHMKYLHANDPKKWTLEALAESYPALPRTVKKVLASKWCAKHAEEVLRHDKSVQRNWEAFKKGKLGVSPELHKHLKKFSSRNFKISSPSEVEKYIVKKNSNSKETRKINEFSKIIESHENIKQANLTKYVPLIDANVNREEVKFNDKEPHSFSGSSKSSEQKPNIKTKEQDGKPGKALIQEDDRTNRRAKHFTLKELRKNLESDLMWKKEIDKSDKDILSANKLFTQRSDEKSHPVSLSNRIASSDSDHSSTKKNKLDEIMTVIREENRIVVKEVKKDLDLMEELKIEEFIKIPKHLYKKNHLYKIKDCFYDDDGQFLYRVPGLKS